MDLKHAKRKWVSETTGEIGMLEFWRFVDTEELLSSFFGRDNTIGLIFKGSVPFREHTEIFLEK